VGVGGVDGGRTNRDHPSMLGERHPGASVDTAAPGIPGPPRLAA
jgi:hypothetical protein